MDSSVLKVGHTVRFTGKCHPINQIVSFWTLVKDQNNFVKAVAYFEYPDKTCREIGAYSLYSILKGDIPVTEGFLDITEIRKRLDNIKSITIGYTPDMEIID